MVRIFFILLCFSVCVTWARAADYSVLDSNDLSAVELALSAINMTPRDLAFKKDQVESELVLEKARRFLRQPLALASYGQATLTNLQAAGSLDALANWAREQLEIRTAYIDHLGRTGKLDDEFLRKLPPPVARAVTRLFDAAMAVEPLLPKPDELALAAFCIEQLDNAEVDALSPQARALAKRADDLELQDDELANTLLAASDRLDRAALFTAFGELAHAVDATIAELQTNKFTESFQFETDTPLGKIICGGVGRNVYTTEAFLIIDTGGDDVYENSAGGANGLAGRPISIVIDLGGNDRFATPRSFAQGAGIFGIGILAALGSNSTFSAKHFSQGAGFFGCGMLVAGVGQQQFCADNFCQGAGMFGAGILWQRGGDTAYRARRMAQGFGGTSGCGLLLDASGNDLYYAGGAHPCPWTPGHYFTLAQGFGYGFRPFAGGGVGVLCDLKGDDRYIADVYGQGASYWYSVGLLLDAEGNDSYDAFQYCQGAGIHLSSGALIDWAGDDQYTARGICQGGAHDFSVGLLIDRAGNDFYTANSTAQGGAINNSVALLLDHAGSDFYAGRERTQSQAAGQDGGKREFGSIALLLDLGGADEYSQCQTNDCAWIKPWYGAGLDCEATNLPPPSRVARLMLDEAAPAVSPAATNATPAKRIYAIAPVDPHQPIEWLLRRSMRDTDTEEHRKDAEAAWTELKRDGTNALPYLLTRLDSPSVMVRVKIEDLIDFLSTNAAPILAAGIDSAKNDEVARLCCYFLARFVTATNAIPHVLPLLNREKTQATAFYTLGHLRARAAYAPALAALKSEREPVRLRAAQALGRIGDANAIPCLLAALGDELFDVRYAAEDALVEFGSASLSSLHAAFHTAPPVARRHIIDALAKLGDGRALELARQCPLPYPLIESAVERDLAEKLAAKKPGH